ARRLRPPRRSAPGRPAPSTDLPTRRQTRGRSRAPLYRPTPRPRGRRRRHNRRRGRRARQRSACRDASQPPPRRQGVDSRRPCPSVPAMPLRRTVLVLLLVLASCTRAEPVRVAVGVPDALARPLLNEFGEQRAVTAEARCTDCDVVWSADLESVAALRAAG